MKLTASTGKVKWSAMEVKASVLIADFVPTRVAMFNKCKHSLQVKESVVAIQQQPPIRYSLIYMFEQFGHEFFVGQFAHPPFPPLIKLDADIVARLRACGARGAPPPFHKSWIRACVRQIDSMDVLTIGHSG